MNLEVAKKIVSACNVIGYILSIFATLCLFAYAIYFAITSTRMFIGFLIAATIIVILSTIWTAYDTVEMHKHDGDILD